MLGQEERRAIERMVRFVENSGERLEHMRYIGNDVKDHVHRGRSRACGHARRVVQEHLVGARLEQHWRKSSQVADERGADQRLSWVLAREIHHRGLSEAFAREERVRASLGVHALACPGAVKSGREAHDRGGHRQARAAS